MSAPAPSHSETRGWPTSGLSSSVVALAATIASGTATATRGRPRSRATSAEQHADDCVRPGIDDVGEDVGDAIDPGAAELGEPLEGGRVVDLGDRQDQRDDAGQDESDQAEHGGAQGIGRAVVHDCRSVEAGP